MADSVVAAHLNLKAAGSNALIESKPRSRPQFTLGIEASQVGSDLGPRSQFVRAVA